MPFNNSHSLIVIAGGGPAGLATALFVAHQKPGLADRVLVLEKERYPRDKYCAGAVGGRADLRLAEISARVDVPSVKMRGISASLGQYEPIFRAKEGDIGRVIRRLEFDWALAQIAKARGIRILEGVSLTGLKMPLERGDFCTAHTSAGSIRARAVVGADGVGSVVRRSLRIPFGKLRAQVVEVDTELKTPADERRDLLHFDLRDRGLRGYCWDFPTLVDGRPMVCRGSYVLASADGKLACDPFAVQKARMQSMGLDIQSHRVKRFAERGFEPELGLSRPNVLLVGEAAGIDPMLGEGIAQAIEYGALAGKYLSECIDRNDFQFDDWKNRVMKSRLGIDMRLRRAILEPFFGAQRELIEDFLIGQPNFLQIGMQYFGGRRISRPLLMALLPKLLSLGLRIGRSAYSI